LVEKALTLLGNSTSAIVGGAFSVVSVIFKEVYNAVIAVVFCVYCLFQKENLARQGRKLLYAFLKEKTADGVVRVLRLTNTTFSNFFSGQCVEVCILGAMFAICMAIFRMPYIPLISVVIAITAFIPIVGAWTGCILGAFLIFVKDPMLAVWFVVMFLILQQIENNLIYPRVVGTSVGLSGMWVLVAVAVGGKLMGVAGMFLMIPVTSVLYAVIKDLTNKKLTNISVEEQKLQPQPPELLPKLRTKRKKKEKQEAEAAEDNNA
jgi:predicted PurR-regulated permease PerM